MPTYDALQLRDVMQAALQRAGLKLPPPPADQCPACGWTFDESDPTTAAEYVDEIASEVIARLNRYDDDDDGPMLNPWKGEDYLREVLRDVLLPKAVTR